VVGTVELNMGAHVGIQHDAGRSSLQEFEVGPHAGSHHFLSVNTLNCTSARL
jgi:hypothetical protein